MRLIFSSLLLFLSFAACAAVGAAERKTEVAIVGEAFHINGQPTYTGRTWQGHKIEGLLLNSRMVQGIFDDLNPETVSKWAYPDTKKWDAERNTREFLAAMPALGATPPSWFGPLYGVMLLDVVLLSSLYAIAFVAALRRVPLFPSSLTCRWGRKRCVRPQANRVAG